jgi:hypothetical protein
MRVAAVLSLGAAIAAVATAATAERQPHAQSEPQAQPQQTYRAELRVAYLLAALGAVRQTPAETLDHANEYARVLDRGACASAAMRLKVECLMTAARRYCRGKTDADAHRCPIYMDLAISNVLADRQLIPTDRRYEIMRRHRDPRRALAHEIRRMQGALAVDFRLRMGAGGDHDDKALARSIDQYCLLTADTTSLSWQACASSLVWFLTRAAGAAQAKGLP